MHKLDRFSPVDYEALRGGCRVALLEIKYRPELSSTTFSTYLIGQRKVKDGLKMAAESGVPYFLFVKWGEDEQRGYWRGVLGAYIVEAGGRRDRADPADVELCCHIPISNFTFF